MESRKFYVIHIFVMYFFFWASPCKNVSSDICGQRRPRSACASAQSDQGLHCPLTESLDTIRMESKAPDDTLYMCRMI